MFLRHLHLENTVTMSDTFIMTLVCGLFSVVLDHCVQVFGLQSDQKVEATVKADVFLLMATGLARTKSPCF
jgi:hypothetical protein